MNDMTITPDQQAMLDRFVRQNKLFYAPDPAIMENHRIEQRSLRLALGEDGERIAGDGAVMARALQRVAQRVMLLHQHHGLGEVLVADITLL